MNFLFLSPFFPPSAAHYCRALAGRGLGVLAIGDQPIESQPVSLKSVLIDYSFEPRMSEYPALHAATERLVARHGALHRLDSNGEHWLEFEGRLRDDFLVPGLSRSRTRELRSKLAMCNVFERAGIAHPKTVSAGDRAQLLELAMTPGLPLVLKPDSGSGAVDTFTVENQEQLHAALARDLRGHVAQPFVAGQIVTFDGLTDRAGQIIFSNSHAYDNGIMQVRQGELDGHYYSLRELPAELVRVGQQAVAAFDLPERFFHLEFFAREDGTYVGLEMNIRPPGGFSVEMMSAACNLDVFDLWAAVISGANLESFRYERHFHTAHAGRRNNRKYRLARPELERTLGETLFAVEPVPEAFASTMGNVAYLLKHADLSALREAVALVQS
ncbi:MAG: ATP-grasp domain-containing protein [Polyangiaceae bacterium]